MKMKAGFAIALAVFGGIAGAIQPKVNAELASSLSSDIMAALVSFCAGLVVLLGIVAFRKQTRAAVPKLRTADAPWWAYFTGLSGVVAVTSAIIVVPTLGVALFSIALYAGSVLAGLLVDRMGLGPGGRRSITLTRAGGAALALSAVAIAQFGSGFADLDSKRVMMLGAVVGAGALTAFQSAGGGRLGAAVGDGFAATLMNFSGGLVVLVAIVVVMAALGRIPAFDPPSAPWLYLGGPLGVTFITSSFVAVVSLGVFRVTLAILAGQLCGGIAIDLLVPSADPLHPTVFVGVAAIFAAVALSGRGSPRAQPAVVGE